MKNVFLSLLSFCFALASFGQGINCLDSEPFCTGTNFTFPASTNVPSLGQVDCLYTTPNPAWYYMEIASPGNIDIHIASGGDVDFICWGPFSSLAAACATSLMTTTGLDCSYSTAATEDCNLTGTQSGQVYVLLITNYANMVTNITFNQTGGTGSTNCGIIAPPTLGDTVCVGETIYLTVNNPVAGATYTWTGPNGFTSNQMNPTIPNATTSMSGIYAMQIHIGTQVSPAVNCLVTVNPNPTVTITPANPATCAGMPIALTGNSNGPAPTYVWSTGSSVNPLTVNPTVNTTYSVTSTDENGCSGSAVTQVTINPSLVVRVTPSAPAICIGEFADLVASGGVSYTWTPTTGLSCTDCPNPSANPLVTTTYTVAGIDANGCAGATTVTVTASVGPNFTITPAQPVICRGDTCKITVNGGSNITWSPAYGLNAATGNVVIASPNTTVTYTVMGDNNGCTATESVTVTVTPTPEMNFSANVTEGCENLVVQFTDQTHPAVVQWNWSFGDGSGANQSNHVQNPMHLFEHAGTYDVTLTGISPNGCVGTMMVPQMITVHKNPVADFIYNPMVADELDQLVWFDDQSVNADAYFWDFGESYTLGNSSSDPNPTHEYNGVGTYIVTLAVESEFGCVDTVRKPVVIEPLITFYAPNAFTPNNDGLNDVFITYGYGINESTFEMRIYDRWGQQMFFTPDINRGWDGLIGGQVCHLGVYMYVVTFIDVRGYGHQYKGSLDLYR